MGDFVAYDNILGDLPLQGFRFKTEGITLEDRHCTYGVRALDREARLGQEAIFTHDRDTRGDITSGILWPNVEGKRIIPAWRYGAWPAITTGGTDDEGIGGLALPVFNDEWALDERFEELEFSQMKGCPPTPVGMPILILDAQIEDEQQPIGFPVCGPGILIAHWRNEDASKFSTLVYDIDDEGKIDDDPVRGIGPARLDTAWRVCPPKFVEGTTDITPSGPTSALAWNCTDSPTGVGGWGLTFFASLLFVEGRPVPIRVADDGIYAHMSAEMGGPLFGGVSDDKHKIGETKEGFAINVGHIQTGALYFMDPFRDGPMRFERAAHLDGAVSDYIMAVHLRFSGSDWAWHSYSMWEPPQIPPIPPDVPIPPPIIPRNPEVPIPPQIPKTPEEFGVPFPPFIIPQEFGVPFPPDVQPPGGKNPAASIPTELKPLDLENLDPLGGRRPPVTGPSQPPLPPAAQFPLPIPGDNQPGVMDIPPFNPFLPGENQTADGGGTARVPARVNDVTPMSTHLEACSSGLSFKPIKVWRPGKDIRYTSPAGVARIAEYADAPVTFRSDAFGECAANDLFKKNRGNGGQRYASLTGDGGLGLFAPELGIEDVRLGQPDIPSSRTESETCLALFRRVALFLANLYDEGTGKPVDGYKFQLNTDGNVVITHVSDTSVTTQLATFTPTGIVLSQPIRVVDNSASPSDTLLALDHTVAVDNSFGTPAQFTFNLLDATSIPDGTEYQVSKGAGVGFSRRVRLTPFGGQTIGGKQFHDLPSVNDAIDFKNFSGLWLLF